MNDRDVDLMASQASRRVRLVTLPAQRARERSLSRLPPLAPTPPSTPRRSNLRRALLVLPPRSPASALLGPTSLVGGQSASPLLKPCLRLRSDGGRSYGSIRSSSRTKSTPASARCRSRARATRARWSSRWWSRIAAWHSGRVRGVHKGQMRSERLIGSTVPLENRKSRNGGSWTTHPRYPAAARTRDLNLPGAPHPANQAHSRLLSTAQGDTCP